MKEKRKTSKVKREFGTETCTTPLSIIHDKPTSTKIVFSRIAIVLTIGFWVLYVISTIIKYINTIIIMNNNVYTVTQINRLAGSIMKESFPNIYIRGEISDLSIQNQGWVFLTLKDNESKIRCVDFSRILYTYKDKLSEGLDVIINGSLSIFEKRGEYQFIAKEIEIIGSGDILEKIEKLKIQLQNKGYFDKERKKIAPRFPIHIGETLFHY